VISITIMGSFFGFVGMLIGAPLFSVLYTIVKEHTEKRLSKRNLPTETAAYSDLNPLNVFEESVGVTEERFTETIVAELPATSETVPEETSEPVDEISDGVPAEADAGAPVAPDGEETECAADVSDSEPPKENETEGEG
ncbi:MAG: hypothetical protein J6P88_04105, partial [Clostridia bacterium]|nr:hypothetical protein [Clostridia bacterium]